MEPRKGGNGVRYDLPENGSYSGSSGSSTSSYVSLLDGVHGGSRTKADARRRTPPLWALAFIAFIPIVMFPIWSRLSLRKAPPPPEQGRGIDLRDPGDPGPEQPEEPASTGEEQPARRKITSVHSPFMHSSKVQKLLAWVENAKHTEGARPDWKESARQSVAQGAGFPDVRSAIPASDKFSTLLVLRGKQVGITATLFNISEGWDGPAVAKELKEPLLRELDEATSDEFLRRLPTRVLFLRAGSSDTGMVLVTLNVNAVSPHTQTNIESDNDPTSSSTSGAQ